jgi:hypothetical protein
LEEGDADPSLKIRVKDWDSAGRNGVQGGKKKDLGFVWCLNKKKNGTPKIRNC